MTDDRHDPQPDAPIANSKEPEKRRGAFYPLPDNPQPSPTPTITTHQLRPFLQAGFKILEALPQTRTVMIPGPMHFTLLSNDEALVRAVKEVVYARTTNLQIKAGHAVEAPDPEPRETDRPEPDPGHLGTERHPE